MSDAQRNVLKEMAENVIRLAHDRDGQDLAPGPSAVDWMAGWIPRLRLFDKEEKEGIILGMGSLLGESILARYGGEWDLSTVGWAIILPDKTAFNPVEAVRRQFNGGPSIADIFGGLSDGHEVTAAPPIPTDHQLRGSAVESLKACLFVGSGLFALNAVVGTVIVLVSRNAKGALARQNPLAWLIVGGFAAIAALSATGGLGISGPKRRWPRILSRVLGYIYLVAFPLGTILGFITLHFAREAVSTDLTAPARNDVR